MASGKSPLGQVKSGEPVRVCWLRVSRGEFGPAVQVPLRATCVKVAQARGWKPEEVAELTGDSIRTIQRHYAVPTIGEMAEAARTRPLL